MSVPPRPLCQQWTRIKSLKGGGGDDGLVVHRRVKCHRDLRAFAHRVCVLLELSTILIDIHLRTSLSGWSGRGVDNHHGHVWDDSIRNK